MEFPFFLTHLSTAFMLIGISILSLAASVESSLLTESCAASASGEEGTGQRFPLIQLKTNRGLLKYVLLSLITFDIYGIIVMTGISDDINIIATRYDKRKTMSYLLIFFLFSWLTLGIAPLVWSHRMSARIGDELKRREIYYPFGAETFWLWNILGSLIVVGPFVYLHKLLRAMNLLSEHYNSNG